jgi:hypothetical protein
MTKASLFAMTSGILFASSVSFAQVQSHSEEGDFKAILRSRLPADYEKSEGCEKRDYLWETRIEPTHYQEELPPLSRFSLSGLSGLALNTSFNRIADEYPTPRQKLFHSFGSVAKVEFEPVASTLFTGLFKGACGLLRLSLAADPQRVGFIPGAALKLFVDGAPSENLQFMASLDPQTEPNFFLNSFSNAIGQPQSPIFQGLANIFALTGFDPFYLRVDSFAAVTARGFLVEASVAPEVIVFAPTPEVNTLKIGAARDVRLDLTSIPEGTVLWDVYGTSKALPQTKTLMGSVRLSSTFVASAYADSKLFFRHNGAKPDPKP